MAKFNVEAYSEAMKDYFIKALEEERTLDIVDTNADLQKMLWGMVEYEPESNDTKMDENNE